MTLDPHIAVLAVITTGIGAVMIRLGLRERMLDDPGGRRRCQACGRLVKRGRCGICDL